MTTNTDRSARTWLEWDRKMLGRFKRVYTDATKLNVDMFTFEGHEYVVGYAKYLIEYLEGQFHAN